MEVEPIDDAPADGILSVVSEHESNAEQSVARSIARSHSSFNLSEDNQVVQISATGSDREL